MIPFADDPFGSTGLPTPQQEHWPKFNQAMGPIWRVLHLALSRQKPKQWKDYRCEIEVAFDRVSGNFLAKIHLTDGVSPRGRNFTSPGFLDLVFSLHEAYRIFDPELEWRKVILGCGWNESRKERCNYREFEYGRSFVKPADNSLN